MAITDITNKIIEDAKQEATHILEGAERAAQEKEERTRKEKENLTATYTKQIEQILSENEKKNTSVANQEIKLHIDVAKRTAINKVFAEALEDLNALPDKEYAEIIRAYVQNIPKEAEGEIVVSHKREKITASVLKEEGLTQSLTVSEDFAGGIRFVSDTFEMNATFEKILTDEQSTLETQVASILFTETEAIKAS